MNAKTAERLKVLSLLGPALVAGVAYIDPGNVATNLSAGAQFAYQLTWVIGSANLVAWLVQFLSAKLGLVTSKSMPELLGSRFKSKLARYGYYAQAQTVAIATDVAEVLGGAIALNLLFRLDLLIGGLITGVVSMALLTLQGRGKIRGFESVIIGLILITGIGFVAALVVSPPSGTGIVAGLVPQFSSSEAVLLAAGIVGATIMPHAIYAHSALSRDRLAISLQTTRMETHVRAAKWDVSIAMIIAGAINLSILFVGASALFGTSVEATITGAYSAIHDALGDAPAVFFAVGLLASGLASSSVGTYAGAEISQGLLKRKLSPLLLRSFTLIPALLAIALSSNPTQTLIYSQVLLSFGLPFALFPLIRLTSDKKLMGKFVNRRTTVVLGYLAALVIAALNVYLIILQFA